MCLQVQILLLILDQLIIESELPKRYIEVLLSKSDKPMEEKKITETIHLNENKSSLTIPVT